MKYYLKYYLKYNTRKYYLPITSFWNNYECMYVKLNNQSLTLIFILNELYIACKVFIQSIAKTASLHQVYFLFYTRDIAKVLQRCFSQVLTRTNCANICYMIFSSSFTFYKIILIAYRILYLLLVRKSLFCVSLTGSLLNHGDLISMVES